jgi:hypothetical protein
MKMQTFNGKLVLSPEQMDAARTVLSAMAALHQIEVPPGASPEQRARTVQTAILTGWFLLGRDLLLEGGAVDPEGVAAACGNFLTHAAAPALAHVGLHNMQLQTIYAVVEFAYRRAGPQA